ncbi:hypothetical protein [Emticicia sp. C21]|uniref:hypothetical protein n=1 Tax=Emticicia sp. C21 TaxID=2302915 RepID=UPI000E34485F|nr:hypothetical protein [Emticicia sp. C21]RFS15528.1 hypothetical protein D0T08_15370 [Emticicia sp. C21]
MEDYPLKDWIPYKLDLRGSESILCEWRYIADKTFTEPFFQESTSKCTVYQENRKMFKPNTQLKGLVDFANKVPAIEPTAFIFHVSRCGSTLLAQLLSLDPQHIVISEAPILDEVMREIFFSKFEIEEEEMNVLIRSVIKLLGKKRTGHEKHLFVKLDSWHIFYYEKLRILYPDTPFIFSYRRPDEVIRSQLKSPGMHAAPGVIQPALFGYDLNDVLFLEREVYISRVLEKYFENYLRIVGNDEKSIFVNYADGILPIFDRIVSFLNLDIEETIKTKMIERTHFHSKSPNTVFEEKPLEDEIPAYQQKVFKMYKLLENKSKN